MTGSAAQQRWLLSLTGIGSETDQLRSLSLIGFGRLRLALPLWAWPGTHVSIKWECMSGMASMGNARGV